MASKAKSSRSLVSSSRLPVSSYSYSRGREEIDLGERKGRADSAPESRRDSRFGSAASRGALKTRRLDANRANEFFFAVVLVCCSQVAASTPLSSFFLSFSLARCNSSAMRFAPSSREAKNNNGVKVSSGKLRRGSAQQTQRRRRAAFGLWPRRQARKKRKRANERAAAKGCSGLKATKKRRSLLRMESASLTQMRNDWLPCRLAASCARGLISARHDSALN